MYYDGCGILFHVAMISDQCNDDGLLFHVTMLFVTYYTDDHVYIHMLNC